MLFTRQPVNPDTRAALAQSTLRTQTSASASDFRLKDPMHPFALQDEADLEMLNGGKTKISCYMSEMINERGKLETLLIRYKKSAGR